MTVFVFLGPSLARDEALAILEAEFLPPARMGDIYTLVASRAKPGDCIALIDGFFEQVPAVWHKEILYALSKNICVYGASSMGALRAAELHSFGMRGIGKVFEAFRSGELQDDDEVAVAHAQDDHGFRTLSHAMVSLRFGLQELVGNGVMGVELCSKLMEEIKSLPYFKRSWAAVIAEARSQNASPAIVQALRHQARLPDIKALDAIALLRQLVDESNCSIERTAQPTFIFQNTSFWTALTQSQSMRVEASRYSKNILEVGRDQEISAFFRAGGAERDQVLSDAILNFLALDAVGHYSPSAAELAIASRDIAKRNGLNDRNALEVWRREQRLDGQEWRQVLAQEAKRRWIHEQLIGQLDNFVIRALKTRGLYGKVRLDHDRALRELHKSAGHKATLEEFSLTPADLQAWYEARFGSMVEDPKSHAQHLGFSTLRDFVDSILEQYIASLPAPGNEAAVNETTEFQTRDHV